MLYEIGSDILVLNESKKNFKEFWSNLKEILNENRDLELRYSNTEKYSFLFELKCFNDN